MTTLAVDGETLLARLNVIFTEDPAIDEIGLLFGVEAEDLTPDVAFQLAEHKLGVAFSAGPLVFRAARTRFHALNAKLHAGEIVDGDSDAASELLATTRAVLLISADFYTAWNTRKEFVRRGWLSAASEVTFTSLVFSLHPKSIDTWAYRRWLATRLTQELSSAELQGFFDDQVALCAVLADRFPRNYHAWSFRHWIVSRLEHVAALERELALMQTWCETHLKDHSGWNHRQHTISCLLRVNDEAMRFELLVREFVFLSAIVAKYPMYEALWCHRRFVMQSLLATAKGADASEKGLQGASEAVLSAVQDAGLGAVEENEDQLQSAFDSVRGVLVVPADVPCAALQDVGVAWRCGNRFARRYAAWLVQRLQGSSLASEASLEKLNQAMRISLETSDTLLEHLWRAESTGVVA